MKKETQGKIIHSLIPGFFLLGTRLGDWYERNPYHKFNNGDILIRKDNASGYGIKPVAIVKDYVMARDDRGYKVGKYKIIMHKGRRTERGIERIVSENETHFKWNIEYQFRKVNVNSVKEARALYG